MEEIDFARFLRRVFLRDRPDQQKRHGYITKSCTSLGPRALLRGAGSSVAICSFHSLMRVLAPESRIQPRSLSSDKSSLSGGGHNALHSMN